MPDPLMIIPRNSQALTAVPVGKLNDLDKRLKALENKSTGVSLETPPETPDGVRTTFTLLNTPKWISVDGGNKFATTNYTYVGTTLTITDGAPPTVSIVSFY